MASHAAGETSSGPLRATGRVDLIRVQVGYRAQPDGAAYQQFLLDLPAPEPDSTGERDVFDESRVLAALEPVLYVGADVPRHHSLHQHRWHNSWGAKPGGMEIGLLVTTGSGSAAVAEAANNGVTRAFRDLLAMTGTPTRTPTSRHAAIQRARSSTATAYAVDPAVLSLSTEEHHQATNSWSVGLRTTGGENYEVLVGLVDGYAPSVRVRHEGRSEVFDSVGVE